MKLSDTIEMMNSEDFKELINLGDYILTGGDINNQSATI